MPAKRSGLGRGLDALLPKGEGAVQQLPLERLQVSAYQPRKHIDPERLAELTASVADKGVLQPILVRPVAAGYEIIAGERRFRAAQEAGLRTIPALVKALTDQQTLEIAIVENLQREDLGPLEEARAFQQLLDFGLNQEAVAKAVSKSRSAVANALRLLKLEPAALEALAAGTISPGHARAILAQPAADRAWALEQIVAQGLTVREAEKLERPSRKRKGRRAAASPHATLEEDLARSVGTRVRIRGEGKGKIELFYFTRDELTRLLELLGYRG